jgi:hypothetical protein
MERDAEAAPDFAATLARARARSRDHRGVTRGWRLLAVAAALALAVGALWLARPARVEPAEWPSLAEVRALDRWRPPTDTLLGSPARELIETTPAFGGQALEAWGLATGPATQEDPS